MPIWIINDIKTIYFDRIDISEGTGLNKSSESKEYICLLVFLK